MTTIHNLNDRATVTLTAEGAAAANAHYDKVFANLPARAQSVKPHYHEGATLSTELWHLMQVFGKSLLVGGPNLFKDNRVAIKPVQ